MTHRIAITPGEPAGIGPDLCIAIAQRPPSDVELVIVADPKLLENRAAQLGQPLRLKNFEAGIHPAETKAGELTVLPVALRSSAKPGVLDKANADYVLETLRVAAQTVSDGDCDAMVTGPVHKGIINDAGNPFSGHTEYLAEFCKQDLTVMMLAITKNLLRAIIKILNTDLQSKFGIVTPRILVCGLNPHAGEGGHLGSEEIETIEPVLDEMRDQGINLVGPLPADTLFTAKYLATADAVLAMYHDQGLPVLKFKGFGAASNITLGLPIIRTSVDHGTALDLAATGKAETGSLRNAITTALEMSKHWRQS